MENIDPAEVALLVSMSVEDLTSEVLRLRTLCRIFGLHHGAHHDPANAQITVDFTDEKDSAEAWIVLSDMGDV